MRVTKVYDDGRLVSCKKTGADPLGQVDSRCLAALGKEFSYEMHAFLLNVSALKKELKATKRLLLSRTKERDSVKKGHRKRLVQVYFLRERMEEAKLEYLILQEDLSAWISKSKAECAPPDTVTMVNSKRSSPPPLEPRPSKDAPEDHGGDMEESQYTFSVKATAIKKG